MPSSRTFRTLLSATVCIAVSGLGLFLALRRVDFNLLRGVFLRVNWLWLSLAWVAFGLGCFTAGWRFHLMVKLTRTAVHIGASLRTVIIGHFFYTIFFGAAGGDLARTGLYTRWYRFDLARVLTAVSLDRVLGLSGIMGVGGLALLVGLASGGMIFPGGVRVSQKMPVAVAAGAFAIPIVLFVLYRSPRLRQAMNHLKSVFFDNARRLMTTRSIAWRAFFWAFLVQAFLAGVLALNLRAVTAEPLPWGKLIWVFPVIFVFSALPISVGGLGLRENSAVLLLTLYGVDSAHAIAASLLTFAVTVAWAVVGAAVFVRENLLYRKGESRLGGGRISVVIPTLNEEKFLSETIAHLRSVPEIAEVIVVDGGSTDRTCEVASGEGCRVLEAGGGRGGQMREGARVATGDIILLLHADTWVPPEAGQAILNCLRDPTVAGGGFWKVFRNPTFLLRGSGWKCALRLWLTRRIAGDQGIFTRRATLEKIGGVPDLPLMEEFELCRALKTQGRLALAEATIKTSARRFLERGVAATYLRMWRVTIQYRMGTSPETLRRLYEKR